MRHETTTKAIKYVFVINRFYACLLRNESHQIQRHECALISNTSKSLDVSLALKLTLPPPPEILNGAFGANSLINFYYGNNKSYSALFSQILVVVTGRHAFSFRTFSSSTNSYLPWNLLSLY